MDNPGEILLLCRLCLVKDQVNIPIFEEQGDIRQIFLKISSCLPIKVSRDDQLPKKICDGCSNKLDLLYEFWNTSANAEKTLLSWLGQAGVKDADETINAVAQQIAKPAETQVKEETETLEDGHVNSQNQDNFEPQSFDEGTKDEDEAPPPKRARRSAAVKAQINITPESDDDDDLDSAEPMTKMEGESDESDGEEKDPSYAEVPGTSADDQAGPSGVGKDGAEAPVSSEVDTHEPGKGFSGFEKRLFIKLRRYKEDDAAGQQQTTTSLGQKLVSSDHRNVTGEKTNDAQKKTEEKETKKPGNKPESKNTGYKAEKTSAEKSSKYESKSRENVGKIIQSKSQVKTDSKKSGSSGNIKNQNSSAAEDSKQLIQNILGKTQAEKSSTTSKFKIPHKIQKPTASGELQERLDRVSDTNRRTPDRSRKEKSVERMFSQTSEATKKNKSENSKENSTQGGGKGTVASKQSSQSNNIKPTPPTKSDIGCHSQHTTQKPVAQSTDPNQILVRKFYCHKCGKMFEDFGKLHEHIFKSTDKGHLFRCESCEYIVGKTLTNITIHITRYCPREKFSLCEANKLRENPNQINYFCERCGKSIDSFSNLNSHYDQHLGESLCCNLCDKKFSDFSEILLHYREHLVVGNLYLACKFCPLEFYATEPYILHNFTVHSHVLNIPFECDLCVKIFFDEEEKFLFHVQSHCQMNSNTDRPSVDVSKLTCEVCAEIFDNVPDCMRHKDEIHKSEVGSNRTCPKCKKDVAISTMSNHLFFHRLERAAALPKNERKTLIKSDKELKRLCPPGKNSASEVIATGNQKTFKGRIEKNKKEGLQIPQQEILSRPHTETARNLTQPQLYEDFRRHSVASQPATYANIPVLTNERFRAQSNSNSNYSGPQSRFSPSSILSKQFECKECRSTFLSALALKEHMKSHLLKNSSGSVSPYVPQPITEPNTFVAAVMPCVDKSSFSELRPTLGGPQFSSQQYTPQWKPYTHTASSSTSQNYWQDNFMGQIMKKAEQPHGDIYPPHSYGAKPQSSFLEWSSHGDEGDLNEGRDTQITGTPQHTSQITTEPRSSKSYHDVYGQAHVGNIPESYVQKQHTPNEYDSLNSDPRLRQALSPTVGQSDNYSQAGPAKAVHDSGATRSFPEWSSYDEPSNLDSRDIDVGKIGHAPRSSEATNLFTRDRPSDSGQLAYDPVEDERPTRKDPRSYRNWDTEQKDYMRQTNSPPSKEVREMSLSPEMEESYLDRYNREVDTPPATSIREDYELRQSPVAPKRRRSRSREFEQLYAFHEREYVDTTYSATSRNRRSPPARAQRRRSPSPPKRERYRSRSPHENERSRSPLFSRRRKSPMESRRRYADRGSRY